MNKYIECQCKFDKLMTEYDKMFVFNELGSNTTNVLYSLYEIYIESLKDANYYKNGLYFEAPIYKLKELTGLGEKAQKTAIKKLESLQLIKKRYKFTAVNKKKRLIQISVENYEVLSNIIEDAYTNNLIRINERIMKRDALNNTTSQCFDYKF